MAATLIPLILALQAGAPPQIGGAVEPLYTVDGGTGNGRLGQALAVGPDMDGDSVADYLVSADLEDPGSLPDAGSVYLLSGVDGTQILRLDGVAAGDRFGAAVAFIDDVDGDSVADILVGAPGADPAALDNAGALFLMSGATGAQILRVDGSLANGNLGVAVCSPGDLDGDLIPDLVGGAEWADDGLANNGRIIACSGANGALLYSVAGADPQAQFGCAVADAPDIDGDLVPDFVVGARGITPPGGNLRAGRAYVLSGVDGTEIYHIDGGPRLGLLGAVVARLGDLDGDGVDDLGSGAYNARGPGAPLGAGQVRVWSGATGVGLFSLNGAIPQGWFGRSLANAGDCDGDGIDDILVGANLEDNGVIVDSGTAYVISGREQSLMFRMNGEIFDGNSGYAVAGGGDLDGDGNLEVLVTAAGADTALALGAGQLIAYRLDPFLRGDLPEVSQAVGGTLTYSVDFPLSEAGVDYLLLVSVRPPGTSIAVGGLQVPIIFDNVTQSTMAGNYPSYVTNAQGQLDGNGDTSIVLAFPPAGLPAGAIGRRLRMVVLTGDFVTGIARMSTIAQTVTVLP